MPLYRARRTLGRSKERIPKGALTRLEGVPKKTIDKLLEVGCISEVAPPPLNILPGWKEPAEKLEGMGVKMVVDFLEARTAPLSRVLKITPKEVQEKKKSVEGWLIPATDGLDEESG